MPADPIVPSRAAPWDNSSAVIIPQPGTVAALCRQATNLASFTPMASSIDGVSLQGVGSTAGLRLVLLASQTTPAQNGLYVTGSNGATVSVTGNFDGSGNYLKTGLTVGRLYYWLRNTAGNTVTNGTITLTESGFIAPSALGQLTMTGTASAAQLNYLVEANLERSTEFNAVDEFPADLIVRVDQGSGSKPEYWRLNTQPVTMGTSGIVFSQLLASAIVPSRATAWDNTSASAIVPSRATAWDNTPAQNVP